MQNSQHSFSKDSIGIYGLQIFAKHGLYEKERIEGNTFEIDVVAELSQPLAEEVDLNSGFDYETATSTIYDIMQGPSMLYLEEIALKIGHALFSTANHSSLTVKVRKLNPPVVTPAKYSEVSLSWPRPSSH